MELFSTITTLIFTFNLLVLVCNAEFNKKISDHFEEFLKTFNADMVDDPAIRKQFPYGGTSLNGRSWATVFSRRGELAKEYDNKLFFWEDDSVPAVAGVEVQPERGIVSFGGFDKEEQRTEYMKKVGNNNKRPVILLHGISHGAEQMVKIAKYLNENTHDKHGMHEIYAFTWGPKDNRPDKKTGKMDCHTVKQVRIFILAVLAYTGATAVNIVGLSTGVLLARKAILGGPCVDEKVAVDVAGKSEEHNFNLGERLTHKIHTFIGVSGPNRGSLLCSVLAKIPTLDFQSCNRLDGFHPKSTYLADINKVYDQPGGDQVKNYEGEHVFSIITPLDKRVYFHYQKQRGAFANGCLIKDTETIKVNGHVQVLYKSKELILRMLQKPAEAAQICKDGGKVEGVDIKSGNAPSLEESEPPAAKASGGIDYIHLLVKASYFIPRLIHPDKFKETPAASQISSRTILRELTSMLTSHGPEIPATIG